jgi:hypothetical protein
MQELTKVCNKCKIQKDISSFRKKKSTPNGVSYTCKDCQKTQDTIYRKAYYSDCKLKSNRLQYNREWRNKNRSKINDYSKNYYKEKGLKEYAKIYGRLHHKKEIDLLKDNYIIGYMQRNLKIDRKIIIDSGLVEVKRLQIKLKRAIRNHDKK